MSDLVKQALQALADRNDGLLTPDAVVAAARPRDSALHSFFTWDNKVAADAHRLNEARTLIRSVRVDIKVDRVIVPTPYFIRDPTIGETQGYRSLGRLQTDDELARETAIAEMKRASGALARARAIAAVLGMTDEIEMIEAQIGALIGRAASPDARA